MDKRGMHDELYELAEQSGWWLAAHGIKLAAAESCTGGWIAQSITAVPGSSAWFDRGFVTYSNAAKIDMLGVDPRTLEKYGAVSSETAAEMAVGALVRSDAELAVAVTGIAGPDGGTTEKPVGTVFIAWASKNGRLKVEKYSFAGNRREVREQTVAAALQGIIGNWVKEQ